MKYRESEEMYLETILVMKKLKKELRSIDIASELSYSRPSVSRAVKKLIENNYITVNSQGIIEFTEQGEKKALEIYERHCIITDVLIKLGANKEVAEENACNIEHVISDELVDVLKNYLKNNR